MSLNADPLVRSAFSSANQMFTQETGIKVKIRHNIFDKDREKIMRQWLEEGIKTPDLVYGHGSQRFQDLILRGLVHDVTSVWQDAKLYPQFPQELIDRVSLNDRVYGVPYIYFTWGIFYKKSLVKQYGEPPQEWEAFIDYSLKIKKDGKAIFATSAVETYIAAGWFEYFVLRLYGLALLEQVMDGSISFLDPKLQDVFQQWKRIIDLGLYTYDYENISWEDQIPFFLHDRFAFLFMSSRATARVYNEQAKSQLLFSPFPKMRDIPLYETAPSDNLFIPEKSPNKALAERYLAFMARADIQSFLAKTTNTAPANKFSSIDGDSLAVANAQIIGQAEGISPFFDRGTLPSFEKATVKELAAFLRHGNVQQLTSILEKARIANFENIEK